MITKNDLERLRIIQQKPHYDSEAKEFFANGKFNPDNWNGGDGIIRQFCYEVSWKWDEPFKCYELDWFVDGHEHSGDIIIQYNHYQDFNYIIIIVRGCDNDNDDYGWYLDQYLIQYYKDRGKTDRILYNGLPITEDQYLVLLNMIEQTGFKFRLE